MTSDRPLRLAFIANPDSVHTRRWAGYFADRGHEVHILIPAADRLSREPDPRFRLHRFEAWRRRRIRGTSALATRRESAALLREIDPDVLHAHAADRYGQAAWLSGFRPYAVTVWGSDVLIVPSRNRRARIYVWLALRFAALVTGGSRTLVDAAIRAGARPSRTRYIHFGIDVQRFSPGDAPAALRERLGLIGRRVVFSPRTIGPLYQHETIIRAFARLPPDVSLLMTRHLADEAEVERVMAVAAELGVAGRIVIVEDVAYDEMPDFYRLADVVVSVPASDGGPNTVVETLASGRPIVASDLPANREWLADLDPGSLVPVGDVEATARAIATVLERAEPERERIAAEGRAAVEAQADQRKTMAEMERLYRELAAVRRGRKPARS